MGKVLAVLAAATVAVGVCATAQAQQKLVVAGYGGSFEDIMRKDIFPPFAKQHGVVLLDLVSVATVGRWEGADPLALAEGRRAAAMMDRMGVTGPVATLAPQMLAVTGRMPHPDFATGPFYFRSRALLDAQAE